MQEITLQEFKKIVDLVPFEQKILFIDGMTKKFENSFFKSYKKTKLKEDLDYFFEANRYIDWIKACVIYDEEIKYIPKKPHEPCEKTSSE